MADSKKQSDEEMKGDEESALNEADAEKRLYIDDNQSKCRDRLQKIHVVCIVVCLVLVVCVLVEFSSLTTNFSQPSDAHASSERRSNKTQESTCAYITDSEYWKSIPDNLNEYCTPKTIPDGDIGHVKKRFQCPGTKLYIPLLCLCDYNVTCPNINNNQEEHYRKKSCKDCTKADHCPCQNFGKCKNCTEKKSSSLECLCRPGTNGTYCTKISKRLCTKSEESNGLENCNNSNDLKCVLRLDETYICKWRESMHGVHPNCGLSVSDTNMMKGGMLNSEGMPNSGEMPISEGMRNSEHLQLTTSKILLWAILLLLIMAVILLAIWKFYGKCQTFIKKCRKKKS